MTNANQIWARYEDQTVSRQLREYFSDLSDWVEAGEITPEQAHEWYNAAADRLAQGLG